MTTHYQGSRGPVPIVDMPYTYLRNAVDKLVREGAEDRQAEIDAMTTRLAEIDSAISEEIEL